MKTYTLFNNYCGEGYDFEETKKELEEINDCTFTDEQVWEMISDYEREDWDNAMWELNHAFGDSQVIAMGTCGTWRGNFEATKVFPNIKRAIDACIANCDYIKIEYTTRGHIKVTASHHDGTNHLDIKRVTDNGVRLYDNWNFAYDTKLTEFDICKKIWESSHYSKLQKLSLVA